MRPLLSLLLACAATCACAHEEPLLRLKRGQPAPVARLIERIVECNHWGGEQAYDAERARDIQQAMDRLHCDALAQDEALLRQRYRHDASVGAALDQAATLDY